MGAVKQYAIPLNKASGVDEKIIGGKAAKLAQMMSAGFKVPQGFCITIHAYRLFLKSSSLNDIINMELGRKSFSQMRWEEIWDTALRIRSAFQKTPIPACISDQILENAGNLSEGLPLAVRSSAPKEDTARASFAGIHESYTGVIGAESLLDAVRLVWASLWSDAALLYQHELALNLRHSSMAVVVQEMVTEDRSGVAFGRDPREKGSQISIIEAVPGLCQDLVDGVVDPDRWFIERQSGKVEKYQQGVREENEIPTPLLNTKNIKNIFTTLLKLEKHFGWPTDMEWTGRSQHFTILQARPITTAEKKEENQKEYYLGLRPADKRLKKLASRVADELIPELEHEGAVLAAKDLSRLDNVELADEIEAREEMLEKWKKIYWDEFIPFAHGIRRLGTYYNDAVHPDDPYEFLGLLKGQKMISIQRNEKLAQLAEIVRKDAPLAAALHDFIDREYDLSSIQSKLAEFGFGNEFVRKLHELQENYLNVSYGDTRLDQHPELILTLVLELAESSKKQQVKDINQNTNQTRVLEKKLFDAVGAERQSEAEERLRIGRLSWRLRDDDNLLLGRIENQLLRALEFGAQRLRDEKRLQDKRKISEAAATIIIAGLRDSSKKNLVLPVADDEPEETTQTDDAVKPRQLIGQPASPGLVSGKARIIRNVEDLAKFKFGEVLVCDAIQPNMTHLVPLASAIIERRGGMLIHGAIIARELGIPCVNGVPNAADILPDGELVTVDGNLGIVTVGPPEFSLEGIG